MTEIKYKQQIIPIYILSHIVNNEWLTYYTNTISSLGKCEITYWQVLWQDGCYKCEECFLYIAQSGQTEGLARN